MKIKYHKKFKRQYKKLPASVQQQFGDRLKLFIVDQTNPVLRMHPLKGNFAGYYSINISGDLRALYYKEDQDIVVFALIGTHSQLYS